MKIYFFRHAQKAMDFSGDPDLTAEGHFQASKIVDKVLKYELPQPTEIWVSPKKRAASTLHPLAEQLKIKIELDEGLLEQKNDETIIDFRLRIERVLQRAQKKEFGVLFICSHFDWVVEAMALLNCDSDLTKAEFSHWTPAQYAGFEISKEGLFHFLELKRITL